MSVCVLRAAFAGVHFACNNYCILSESQVRVLHLAAWCLHWYFMPAIEPSSFGTFVLRDCAGATG